MRARSVGWLAVAGRQFWNSPAQLAGGDEEAGTLLIAGGFLGMGADGAVEADPIGMVVDRGEVARGAGELRVRVVQISGRGDGVACGQTTRVVLKGLVAECRVIDEVGVPPDGRS